MTTLDGQDLNDEEKKVVMSGKCPDCATPGLLEGPSGGGCTNIYCANEATCGSRFNVMTPFGISRISNASPNKPKPEARTPFRD